MSSQSHKLGEYEVYDAFLSHLYPRGFSRLVLSCATVPSGGGSSVDFLRREFPDVRGDTLMDFERVSGEIIGLRHELFAMANGIRFTMQPASHAYSLEDIRRDFPDGDGILYLSRIGFSLDEHQALGSVDTHSHRSFPNIGFGYFLLATRVGFVWRVTAETFAWIA